MAQTVPNSPTSRKPKSPMVAKPVNQIALKPASQMVQIPKPTSPMIPKPKSLMVPKPKSPMIPKPKSPMIPKPKSPMIPKPKSPMVHKPTSPMVPKSTSKMAPNPPSPIVPKQTSTMGTVKPKSPMVQKTNSRKKRPTNEDKSIESGEETGGRLMLPPLDNSATNTVQTTQQSTQSGQAKASLLIKIPRIWKANLEDEDFYHGYMSRQESEKILSKQGDFLLRRAEINGSDAYVVSVCTIAGHISHYKVRRTKHGHEFWVHDYSFESVVDLVRFHMREKIPISDKGTLITKWMKRTDWQLYHEQGEYTKGVFSRNEAVAVKTLKEGLLTVDQRIAFLREANVMLTLSHPYVIKIHGVCTQKQPIMIVMEIASGGCLLDRVKENPPPSSANLRKYAVHICRGMKYLESKQIIHRDLAARNVLLNDKDECKISDFGLSVLGALHKEKKMSRLPIRWMAPETLQDGVYMSKSDVWSYGVVLFEMYSYGQQPYSHVEEPKAVRKAILKSGLKLEPPQDMPPIEEKIMMLCMIWRPHERPSFNELLERYKKEVKGVGGVLAKIFRSSKRSHSESAE